jgi:Arm DNA-binding domain
MPQAKLTKRTVDAQKPGSVRFTVWDVDVSGFGLRVTPAGERAYVLKYRARGKQRWYTIGRHGSPWTPAMARREAMRLLGEVARGVDPADKREANDQAETVAQLCDLYLAEGVGHKKASTLKADCGRIAHHIKPLLGRKRVDALTRADAERLLGDVSKGRTAAAPLRNGAARRPGSMPKGGRGAAARTVALLGTIMAFGVSRNIRADNPARGIKLPKSRKMERFLSGTEIARLASSLDEEVSTSGNVFPSAAIKLLLLTGCRRGEVLNLLWPEVDLDVSFQ